MSSQSPLMENSTANFSFPNSSHIGIVPWINDLRMTFYSILLVLSLVGNALIIIVVLCNKPLRTEFNFLIINMAVSDLTVPLVALPIEIAELYHKDGWIGDGDLGNALCKVFYFLIDLSAPVSILSLVAVAINRFLASVYPVRRKLMTSKMTKILLVVAWMIPILFYSPHFYRIRMVEKSCIYSWQPWLDQAGNDQANSIYLKLNVVLFFIGPLIAISILYSIVILKLRKSTKSLSKMLNDHQLQQRKRVNKHIFYMSVVIIIAFAFLWGPFEVLLLIVSTKPPPESHMMNVIIQYGWIAQLLGYSSTVVNPVTCFGFLNNYQNGLKRVFNRKYIFRNDEETNVNRKSTTITSKVMENIVHDKEAILSLKKGKQETIL